MLSYDEALERVLEAAGVPLPAEEIPLESALGRTLAADVFADLDLPPFDNSAVDGYALHSLNHAESMGALAAADAGDGWLRIGEAVHAGDAPPRPIEAGVAVPVFTGAPIPPGTAAIVMWEDTERSADGGVRLRSAGWPGFVRRAGSDMRRGTRAVPAGMTLDAGAIGLLASLNRARVSCTGRPRVGLLSTGNELVPLGAAELQPGQIRDSNGYALAAAVEEAGGVVTARRHVRDDFESTCAALQELAATCDLVISAGGVSLGRAADFVGQTDHVTSALEAVGTLAFWKIAVKPGKPLAFGRIGETLFFGLPGNPVSALVTFELFVRPVLRRRAGFERVLRLMVTATLAEPLPHSPGRREFARARLAGKTPIGEMATDLLAVPLGTQESHRLASMAGADLLLVAHEEHGDYAADDRLPALLLV